MTDRRKHTLPTDSAERKAVPLYRGLDLYFPAALAGVARHSQIGGNKHCGGELYHDRGKSTDHADCLRRHMADLAESPDGYETVEWIDPETGEKCSAREPIVAAIAWRALALAQEWLEQHDGAPLAPAAKLPETPAEKLNRFRQVGGDGTLLRCSVCPLPVQRPGMCAVCRAIEQAAYLAAREKAQTQDGHGQCEPRSIDHATPAEWDAAARKAMGRPLTVGGMCAATDCIRPREVGAWCKYCCDNVRPPTPRTDGGTGS